MTKDIAQPDLALDKSSEQGFLRYFATLTAQENTIRLFERSNGDYYSVHGTDAEHVAQAVYKTRTVIKHLGTPKLPTCTMSRAVAEGFLRDALLQRGQRIEIHAQEAAGWTVSKRASPGNLQAVEAMLFGSSDMVSAPLMAVRVRASAEQMHVGVATVDAAQRVLGVCEFIDSSAFANLEALVIQLGVRECLIESDEEAVGGVLQRCMVVPTELPKKLFSADGVAQDLARLLPAGVPVQGLAELELRHALGALGACLGYLQLAADDAGFGGYALHTHVPGKFMKLDASAVSALSLLQSPDGASRTMSLQGLLNRCKTPQGRRLLDQWLKQPLLSEPEINERLDLVGVFFNNAEARDTLRSTHLRSLPDLKRLATRLQRLQATLQDIVRIYQVAEGLSALCDTLEPLVQMHGAVDAAYLGPLRSCDGDLAPLRQMVETTVDLDMAERHEFVLRADFDEGLQETRRLMDREMARIDGELAAAGRTLDLEPHKKLRPEQHATHGHCLRVSRTDATRLRNHKGRFFELATLKTGVLFTTAALREASRAYRDLGAAYGRAQASLVREVIKITASYAPVLEALNETAAHLDVVLSLAEVSASAPTPYVRPLVKPSGALRLRSARHPCLETHDLVDFIANDVDMVDGESGLLVITGPNMGGKSTYIRQTAVVALMAQIGCFVPCESAELPLFDSILARVGAGDAQLRGVSTFMAEMLDTSAILKTATSRSLVIIDELGRGTSTYDGFGLAWAVAEHIAKEIKCKCLFATHFHELTEMAREIPGVANRHALASVTKGAGGQRGELTLLYRVVEGVCDQSFGIHVAELANFPASVVRLAKRKADELEDFAPEGQPAEQNAGRFDERVVASGSRTIERFLADFAATPGLPALPSADIAQRIHDLRAKYDAEISSNPWVQHIIETL